MHDCLLQILSQTNDYSDLPTLLQGFWNYAQMQNRIIWLWAHNSVNGGTIPKGTQLQDHLLDAY